MGRRLIFCAVLVAYTFGFLSVIFSTDNSGVQSDRSHAPVVSISPWNDASQCMGIPQVSCAYSPIVGESVHWEESLTTWEQDTVELFKILSFEEGFSSKPYLCSAGYVTIGLGTKLHKSLGMKPEDFPITVSPNQAKEWLHGEVAIKDTRLRNSEVSEIYEALSDDRRVVILSMAYQIGVTGLLQFNNMWSALKRGDYVDAAFEAMDSKWARQTPERAERHSMVLGGESLDDVYGDFDL